MAMKPAELVRPEDISRKRDHNVMTSIKTMGTAAITQRLPDSFNHKESIIRVRAAKSWLDVPNIVQNTFQAGMRFPAASSIFKLTQNNGIPKLMAVAAIRPAQPFHPAIS